MRASSCRRLVAGTTDPVLAHGLSLTVPAMYRVFASASYDQRMQTIAFPSGTSSDNGFGIAMTAVPAGTATLTLSPPARAEFSAPAANAPFGAGDVVSWTSPLPSTAGYRLQLVPADGTGTSVYFYAGKVSSFTLPDLTLLGATLEAESYGLRVQGVEPHPTSDEVLTGVVEPSNGIRTLTGSVSERRTVQGAP